ncbi:uncharacterized protein EHS24_007103 [Apiotrichum porosum]|uniref:Nucleoside diphosphate kinase n=1 Tax=Apiotrichum porosum TaxID=105984 RepID=A0A427XX32_9TREE|nr:uncharacterized protein EHS24_007103 [Apiotrichum porosum]RSH83419.1 hypothetical protein EHS24_007103 [Apiotrichum porosum]
MFANSVRQGLRVASRQSVRAFSTQPARAAPRYGAVAAAAGAAVAGFALYQSTQAAHMEGAKTIAGEYKTDSERSFVMPDGMSRQLVGKIVQRFEERGFKLVAIKSLVPSQDLAKEHYEDLSARPFYAGLVKYITSGTPVVAMVWEGKDVIRQGRRIVGATNPQESDPGSIRGQYAVSVGRNLIHASDSFDAATKEIGLWFTESELPEYTLNLERTNATCESAEACGFTALPLILCCPFKWVPHSLSPVAYRDAATAPFVMQWPLGGTVRGTVRAAESRWDGPVSTFPLHHHHLLPWPSPPPPHPPICHAHGSPTHQMETVFPSWAYLVSNPPGRSKNQPYTIGRQHKSGILRNSRSDGLLMVEIKTDHML